MPGLCSLLHLYVVRLYMYNSLSVFILKPFNIITNISSILLLPFYLLFWLFVILNNCILTCFCLYLYSSIYCFGRENNLPSTVKKYSLQFYLVKNLLGYVVQGYKFPFTYFL